MKFYSNTYRILALSLAFLMFFTSVGFAVDIHYCQNEFKSFSIFGKAANCHDKAKSNPTCKHHKQAANQSNISTDISKKDCCENHTFNFKSDQDLQSQSFDFELNQPVKKYINKASVSFLDRQIISSKTVEYLYYRPPLIRQDIPILFQSFLL